MPTLQQMAHLSSGTARGRAGALQAAPGGAQNPAAPADMSDIFNYINPNLEGAKGPGGWLTQTTNPDPTAGSYMQDNNGNQVFVPTPTYTVDQSKIPDKYKGLVTGVTSSGPGSGGGLTANIDWSKVGGSKTADGFDLASLANAGPISLGTGAQPNLYIKSQGGRKQDDMYVTNQKDVHYDPRFGWFTSGMNISHPPEDKSALDYIGQAAQIGVGLLNPAMGLGMGLIQAGGHGIDTGDWKGALRSAAPSLIAAGLGGTFGDLGGLGSIGSSIPPDVARALQIAKTGYGFYNASRGNDPTKYISPGVSLGRMFDFGGGG